jgi:hypothetical protein
MSAATESDRTEKTNFSGIDPGMAVNCISPSQVLHSQPRRESF